jgi:hypothetical protein
MKTRLLWVTVLSACVSWSVGLRAQENKGSSWAPVTEPPAARRAVEKKTVAAPPKPEAVPTAKVDVAPAAKAENVPAAAALAAPANATAKGHVLQGEWKVYWISEDRTTQMNVVQASQTQPGLTSFIGAIGTPSGEGCPLTGTVVDNLSGRFSEGIEVRSLAIISYVVAQAACAKDQLWVEAFGLPNGKVLMSGRATFVSADGKRRYAAIAFGR